MRPIGLHTPGSCAVFAYSQQQYKDFLHQQPLETHAQFYLTNDFRSLQGRVIAEYILYGTWYHHTETSQMLDYLALAKHRNKPHKK